MLKYPRKTTREKGFSVEDWNRMVAIIENLYPIEQGDGITITPNFPGMTIEAENDNDTGASQTGVSEEEEVDQVGDAFLVSLTKDGGSSGGQTSPASWTYTVRTIDTLVILGTGMSPVKQRAAAGKVLSGNGKVGIGYWNAAGVFVLYDANEVEETQAC